MSVLFAIIILLVELVPEKFSTQLLLSDPHHVVVVGGPVPLLPHDHVLEAAHELGAVQLAGPHVIKELNPGQVNDEQVIAIQHLNILLQTKWTSEWPGSTVNKKCVI